MNCYQHPEVATELVCSSCKRPICENCRLEIGGQNYCAGCLEQKLAQQAEPAKVARPGGKSKFWSLVLSVLPGVGYLYLGLMRRGLQTMLLFWGTIFLASLVRMDSMVAFGLPIIMFYSIFDTQHLVRRLNEGEEVFDHDLFDLGLWEKRKDLIGYGLVVIGALALVNNLAPSFSFYLRNILPPLVILGLGIYIIKLNWR